MVMGKWWLWWRWGKASPIILNLNLGSPHNGRPAADHQIDAILAYWVLKPKIPIKVTFVGISMWRVWVITRRWFLWGYFQINSQIKFANNGSLNMVSPISMEIKGGKQVNAVSGYKLSRWPQIFRRPDDTFQWLQLTCWRDDNIVICWFSLFWLATNSIISCSFYMCAFQFHALSKRNGTSFS